MSAPDDESPARALLVALAAMVGVALLVGVAVAGVMLTVVRSSSLGSGEGGEEVAAETLFMPKYQPTEAADQKPPQSSGSPSGSEQKQRKKRPARKPPISLSAEPRNASAGQRIALRGRYPGGDGATLQVQRRIDGSWTEFPVTASVTGGRFSTWIQTSRTGRSPFRMYDAGANRSSNVVVLRIG